MRNIHCKTLIMAVKMTNKKSETYMVGPIIWIETLKTLKNEKCTLQDLDYGEKPEKCEK